MGKSYQSWSFVIMCYNEEKNINETINKLFLTIDVLSPTNFEIIIVDDGSSDNSFQKASELKRIKPNIKIIRHTKNKGIGQTLKTGYQSAKFENIVAIPGDGQFDAEEFLLMPNPPEKSIISFFRKENTEYNVSRNILSLINKKINRFFTGLNMKDVNWVKIYKKEELNKLKLKLDSSLVESEICSKLSILGNNIIENQSKYLPRKEGKSKGASLKIVSQAVKDLIILIIVIAQFRIQIIFNKNSLSG